jgi:DNA polymerase III subunit delta'
VVRQREEKPQRVAAPAVSEPFWSRITGQRKVRERLAENLRSDHAAHAYLFSGPRGIGKGAAALEFAALLLCDNHEPAPCGACPQCAATARLQHPDLHLVFPLPSVPTRKKTVEERNGSDGKVEVADEDPNRALAERIGLMTSMLAADPYARVILPKVRGQKDDQKVKTENQAIRIAQVRSLLHTAALRPFPALRKVFVIFQADTMNEQAQNALLKGLEEPPADGYLLLVTEDEGALLPTIRSRCQRVRMTPLTEEELVQALEREKLPREQAETAARLAHGSLSRARELAGSDLEGLQNKVLQFLRAAAMCDPFKLPGANSELMETGKLPDSAALELLGVFLRDIAAYRVGDSGRRNLTFSKFAENIQMLVSAYPHADLDRAAAAVDESATYLERGYTQDFVLYALAIKLHEALGPKTALTPKKPQSTHA